MNEETFGPVMPIAVASSDGKLLELANALHYGLAAYVYSCDLERAWGRDLGPEGLPNFLNAKHIRARVRELRP